MKKFFVFPVVLLTMFNAAKAQEGCAAFSLQKGDVLTLKQLLPPPLDMAYFKMKPKEQAEFLKKQAEEIKSGTARMREGKMTIEITDKQATSTGFSADATITVSNIAPTPFVLPYKYDCINDTLYAHLKNNFTQIGTAGVSFTGTIAYPLKMKKGDLLPDYTNVFIGYKATGTNKFMLPVLKKSTRTDHVNMKGETLYSTFENEMTAKEVVDSFSSITTTETTFANREVADETTFIYKGKAYKAYIIKYSVLTGVATEVKANYFQSQMQRLVNRNQARAAKKLADNENSMVNFLHEEIFVPELGVVSTSIVKKDGSFFSKTVLE